jgi:hypothetical protein
MNGNMMNKAMVYEIAHSSTQWMAVLLALVILVTQFAPILSETAWNIAVYLLAGCVILTPILRRMALREAFASLGFTDA